MKKILLKLGTVFVVVCISAYAFGASVTVISYDGDVKVIKSGSSVGKACSLNMEIEPGSWISTGKSSTVTVSFDKDSKNITRLEENTLAAVRNDGSVRLEIFDGALITSLKGLTGGDEFKVKTPCGVVGATGTGWGIVTNGVLTDVKVFENRVFLQSLNIDGTIKKGKVWVEEGYSRMHEKFFVPEAMEKLSGSEVRAMKKRRNRPRPKKTGDDQAKA